MRIGEVKKGLRVRLAPEVRERHTGYAKKWRMRGTVRSPRAIVTRPPYAEGLAVYVKWDGMPTPERWDLLDLVPVL